MRTATVTGNEGFCARPEFRILSEEEVWEKLDQGGERNPVAAEITRLTAGYMIRCRSYIQGLDGATPPAIDLNARWPIEKIAVLVMVDFLKRHAVTRH